MTGASAPRATKAPILAASAAAVATAARVLRAGGIVAIPTDTVYGLAAAIDRPDAIARIYEAKGRPAHKAIPVLLSDGAAAALVAPRLPRLAEVLAGRFWPGALTLVVPSRNHVPPPLTSISRRGVTTVAIRVPDCEVARAIIAAVGGALAVTSANASGQEPALAALQSAVIGLRGPDLVIDGGRVAGGVPSTILDLSGETPELLRAGAIPASELRSLAMQEGASPDWIEYGAV